MTSRIIGDLEQQIIDQLKIDGRLSNREIARRLGVSEGTVRSHVKRLEDDGLMCVTVIADLRQLRMRAAAQIGVFVEPGRAHDVATTLAKIPEITFVATTFGQYDIVAIALVATQEQLLDMLSESIARVPGVRRTETMEILRPVRHDYSLAKLAPP